MDIHGHEIAIIGMAGRFPGSNSIDAFWQNVRSGQETITFFTPDELAAAGVLPATYTAENYVRARGVLADADHFDAAFFGFSPHEAEITDPQHRIFLECAWEAMEHAGYGNLTRDEAVAVFAGARLSTYLLNLYSNASIVDGAQATRVVIGNDKDFLPTRVSYQLNLRGPSINVQSTCATSLVAVHLACQSLVSGECDIALAGAVALHTPQHCGYIYEEGGLSSPDGHCRTFDGSAQGGVPGSGVGVLVLKPLGQALADRDTIHAVIKGTAVNNDGAMKLGYAAPSIDGQAAAARDALDMAEVDADTIGYVETHGTATPLGDSIEVAALAQALEANANRSWKCALGSVKTNIGHLDTASGIAAMIKTIMALKAREIPASLHFQAANPAIDFSKTPFYVNTELQPWPAANGPRRAGINSYAIGGTNAHVILEEAPPALASAESNQWQILPLSAKTPTALRTMRRRLAEHIRSSGQNLVDVAHTLQVGRQAFNYRTLVLARTTDEAICALEATDGEQAIRSEDVPPAVQIVFGNEPTGYYQAMSELYAQEPDFRQELDKCLDGIAPSGNELRRLISCESVRPPALSPSLLAILVFATQVALTRLLGRWGIAVQQMDGCGISRYTASYLMGRLTLQEALLALAEPADTAIAGSVPAHIPHTQTSTRYITLVLGQTGPLTAANQGLEDGQPREIGRLTLIRPDAAPGLVQHTLRSCIGQLWSVGVQLNWKAMAGEQRRQRVPLPTYPFEQQRYWVERQESDSLAWPPRAQTAAETSPRLYQPLWRQRDTASIATQRGPQQWLLFTDRLGVGTQLADQLEEQGHMVRRVIAGRQFGRINDRLYIVDDTDLSSYKALFDSLQQQGELPTGIIHCWGVTSFSAMESDHEEAPNRYRRWQEGLDFLDQALGAIRDGQMVVLRIITTNRHCIAGEVSLDPLKALIAVTDGDTSRLLTGGHCQQIDLAARDLEEQAGRASLIDLLLKELQHDPDSRVVAYRRRRRWIQLLEPVPLHHEAPVGGGDPAATYLFISDGSSFGAMFDDWLQNEHGATIIFLDKELAGGEFAMQNRSLSSALARCIEQRGPLNGIIYVAGADLETPADPRPNPTQPRILTVLAELRALSDAAFDHTLDFCLLVNAYPPDATEVEHTQIRGLMEAYAQMQNERGANRWISATWQAPLDGQAAAMFPALFKSDECIWVLPAVTAQAQHTDPSRPIQLSAPSELKRYPRPSIPTTYAAPSNEVEQAIATMWQDILGIQEIGVDDNFFQLGGHSLLVVQLNSRIRDYFQIELPIRALFETPTIAGLSILIERIIIDELEQLTEEEASELL